MNESDILIHFNEENVILTIPSDCSFEDLERSIVQEFDLLTDKKIALSYFHPKFEQWVALKNETHMKNFFKGEVLEIAVKLVAQHDINSACQMAPLPVETTSSLGPGKVEYDQRPQQGSTSLETLTRTYILKVLDDKHKIFKSTTTLWKDILDYAKTKLNITSNKVKLQLLNDSNVYEDVKETIISGDCTEFVIRVAEIVVIPTNSFFSPKVSNPTHYENQTYKSDLKIEEFVPPEKKLPLWKNERYRRGFLKKSRVVDLSNGQRYAKHKGNEERIVKAQEEQYNQSVEKLKAEHAEKQQMVIEEDLQKAAEFEKNENEKLEQTAQNNTRGILNAGFEGAKTGALCGIVSSSVTNAVDVYNGKKSLTRAAVDTVKSGAKSGAVGAVASLSLSSIQTYGVNHGSQVVSQVSTSLLKNSNIIIPIVCVAPQFYEEVKLYWQGKSDGANCCLNLMSIASNTAAGALGSAGTIALLSFLAPGVGTVVGIGLAAAGGAVASMVTNHLMNTLKSIFKAKPEDTLKDALLWFGLDFTNRHLVTQRYKTLVKIHHPDSGGTNESFVKLQAYYSIIAASVNASNIC